MTEMFLKVVLDIDNPIWYDWWNTCLFQVVKKVTSGSGSSASGVSQGSMGSKELHYVLRVLGPAACRHPQLFTEVVKSILRIALPPPPKRGMLIP
jgi:E3 ubiquitin-protein ligase HUWE1